MMGPRNFKRMASTVSGSGFGAPNIHSGATYGDFARVQEFYGDDLRAVATLPGTNTVVAVGDGGCIARSTDKGLTWAYNADPSFGFGGVTRFAHNGTTTYAVGTSGTFMKKEAGSPWTIPTIPSSSGYAPNFKDIAYIDGTIWISAGYDYLAKSTDDGATWTEMYTVSGLADGIYGMSWFDADNGVLAV